MRLGGPQPKRLRASPQTNREKTMLYQCTDGNAAIEIEAATAEAAAQEYVDGGDWGEASKTHWVMVYCTDTDPDGDTETVRVTIDPDEPSCDEGDAHDWRAPHGLVGGIKDNPGVVSHGGGVVSTEVCVLCGQVRVTDTWAQCRETGVQGLDSIEYPEDRLELTAQEGASA